MLDVIKSHGESLSIVRQNNDSAALVMIHHYNGESYCFYIFPGFSSIIIIIFSDVDTQFWVRASDQTTGPIVLILGNNVNIHKTQCR